MKKSFAVPLALLALTLLLGLAGTALLLWPLQAQAASEAAAASAVRGIDASWVFIGAVIRPAG